MRRYYIYQLPVSNPKIFCGFDEIEKVNLKDYVPVYTGEIKEKDDYKVCDMLFGKFNVHHPEGFAGHSLSVSDIIEIKDLETDKTAYYYCDVFGWVILSSDPIFMRDNCEPLEEKE